MRPCRLGTPAPAEDLVYGACAPGWDRRAATVEAWIDRMRTAGIERVCCLLSDGQVANYDGLLAAYRAAFGDDRVCHVPIPDHTLAEPATLLEGVFPFLETARAHGEPVVVHCKAGLGRTGHVLAAWLVYAHGYDPEAALETVADRGREPAEAVRARNATDAELTELLATVARSAPGDL